MTTKTDNQTDKLRDAATELLAAIKMLVWSCTPEDAQPNSRGEIRSVRTPDWQIVAAARAIVAKAEGGSK